jgi:hypothetical protein
VGFFEPPPPPPEPPKQPPQPPWLTPPANVLARGVPAELLVVRTDDAAIVIRNVVAYPNGIEFMLSIRLRRPRHGFLDHPFGQGPGRGAGDGVLRFGVQFSDGAKATTLGSFMGRWPDEEPRVWLSQHGGSGRAESWEFGYWLWPLPPPGPLTFVVAWPAENIPETRTEIDAAPIRDAAAQAEVLWPPVDSDQAGTGIEIVAFEDDLFSTGRGGPPESD